MGSIELLLANFDFIDFFKELFGQLNDGAEFGDALSTAGSTAAGSSEGAEETASSL
ncbi:hypothetical protein [Corynebacterium urogenitale]